MLRRELLRSAGGVLGLVAGGAVGVVGADPDPRPLKTAGTRPNENVPTVATGALGEDPWNEPSELPVGHWILHDNGVGGFTDKADAVDFASNTVHHYTIEDETFVLDSFDDWTYIPEDRGLRFEYVTPPKRKGHTYEIRWDATAETDRHEWVEIQTPFTNRVEIVGRE